jgi:hypothetical protein
MSALDGSTLITGATSAFPILRDRNVAQKAMALAAIARLVNQSP